MSICAPPGSCHRDMEPLLTLLFALQATGTDRAAGYGMMLVSAVIFVYYTIWGVLLVSTIAVPFHSAPKIGTVLTIIYSDFAFFFYLHEIFYPYIKYQFNGFLTILTRNSHERCLCESFRIFLT